jgi:predicted ATPase
MLDEVDAVAAVPDHLADGCARLAGRLLRVAPGLRILATSRELLGVPGEARWLVPPLAVPDPQDDSGPEALARYDGVRLFVDRARLADPGFALDADSAAAVAEICRRLDGLPLALELAAARLRALPVGEVAARLDDRFRLLAGGDRTVDARQRNLRAAVDWSYQLLEEPDRRLFDRLAVFAGGWTVAAAEAVCAGDGVEATGILEGLLRLVDRSLVAAAGGQPARFRMLETLRAYGWERLAEAGEAEVLARRHATWFLDLAERAGSEHGERWLRELDADDDNLRVAMDRAAAGGDHQTALRIAGALGWYWSVFHHEEGRRRLAGVLARTSDGPPTPHLAKALQSAALLDMLMGPTPATLDAGRRSLELFERFGDRHEAALSKLWLGQAELQLLGRGDAPRLLREAEATFGELGDRWGAACAQAGRFSVEAYFGAPAGAVELGERALEGFRAIGDQRGAHLGAVRHGDGGQVPRRPGRGGPPLPGGPGGRQGDRADLDRLLGAHRARQPGRHRRRGRPRRRHAPGGGGAGPAHRDAPRDRPRLQRDGPGRPPPPRRRPRPPAAPAGARHPPGAGADAGPAYPRPGRRHAGAARRSRRGRGRPARGGRAGAPHPPATHHRAGPDRPGLGRQTVRARLPGPALEAALAAGRDLAPDRALRQALD